MLLRILSILIVTITLHAGTTPLTKAIRLEDFEEAKKHITSELVNKPDSGLYHPLTYAVYTGNKDITLALLKAGANPNKVEHNGKTALYVAANLGHPEIITILHQHDAKYPAKNTAHQPLAAAVRAQSYASVNALLTAYPDCSLKEGWPWPKTLWDTYDNPDENNPYAARSALLFASHSGNDKIAIKLIGHGADLTIKDTRGRTSLHYAASNKDCHPDLVRRLINKGLDPYTTCLTEHFDAQTPLEMAAKSGSLEKIKIMLKLSDGNYNAKTVIRAAEIASAYNHREIMHLLYNTVRKSLPTYHELSARHPFKPAIASTNYHIKVPTNRFHTPHVAEKNNPMGKSKTKQNIAIVAHNRLLNHASLLTHQLAKDKNIEVVDRSQMNELLTENTLNIFKNPDAANTEKTLALIPAAELLVMELHTLTGKPYVRITSLNTSTRLIRSQYILPFSPVNDKWIKNIIPAIRKQVQQTGTPSSSATAISFTPITPLLPDSESLQLARTCNLIFAGQISNTKGFHLLTRRQMQHLEIEKAIGNPNSYWQAAWVCEGSLEKLSNTQIKINLSALSTQNGTRKNSATICSVDKFNDGLQQCWLALSQKIRPRPSSIARIQTQSVHDSSERTILSKQAEWFLNANHPHEAYRLANSSFLLGANDKLTLRIMTNAAVNKLTIQKSNCCDHIISNPRIIEPSIRLYMASQLNEYLSLAQCALIYANSDKEKLARSKSQYGVRQTSKVYNYVISKTLEELTFYRTITDDCIIKAHHQKDIKKLDQHIKELTNLYLKTIHTTKEETITLAHLITNTHDYYERNCPEILRNILNRISELAKQDKSNYTLRQLIIKCCRKINAPNTHPNFRRIYLETVGHIHSKSELSPRCSRTFAQTGYTLEESPENKIKRMKQLHKKFGALPYPLPAKSSERFLGTESFGSHSQLIPSLGQQHWETAERTRQGIGYRILHTWLKKDNKQLTKQLAQYLHKPPGKRKLSRNDIICLQQFFIHNNRMTSDLEQIISPYLPSDNANRNSTPPGSRIKVHHLISLPTDIIDENKAIYIHSPQSILEGDTLWIPATSFSQKGDARTYGGGGNAILDRHHLVEINLRSHKTRFVSLTAEQSEATGVGPKQRPGQEFTPLRTKRIILGTTHIYYFFGSNPCKIFAIERKSLDITQIELPLPELLAVSNCAIGNKLYISLGKSKPRHETGEGLGTNMLLTIDGNKIIETLVSSHRKPAISPMDKPTTWIDALAIDKSTGSLSIKSGSYSRVMAPESYLINAIKLKNQQWLPKQAKAINKQAWDYHINNFFDSRAVSIGNKPHYPAADPYGRGQPGALVLTKSTRDARMYTEKWLQNVSRKKSITIIPIQASPLPDSTLMNRKMYVFNASKREDKDIWTGPTITKNRRGANLYHASANELLNTHTFEPWVIGKHDDYYIIALNRVSLGMPSLWKLPRETISKLP